MNNMEGTRLNEIVPSVEGLTVSDFEYLQNTEGLKLGQWERLDLHGRLETAQTFENKMAEIQGRNPIPILVSETPGEYGHYDPNTRSITLNVNELAKQDNPMKIINTIAHEGRHAYQHYAIEHPGFHPNAKEVATWAENFPKYLSCRQYGGLLYRLQPIEADAWKFGQLVEDALTFGRNYPTRRA